MFFKEYDKRDIKSVYEQGRDEREEINRDKVALALVLPNT